MSIESVDFDYELYKDYKKVSPLKVAWGQLRRNRVAMVGLIIISMMVLVAVFADVISDYKIEAIGQNIPQRLQGPSRAHPFGTDAQGRDVFARVVHGTRISLWLGFACTLISSFMGLLLGSLAGYYGGILDNVIMRMLDSIISIPPILLALAIVAALGQSTTNLILAIAFSYVPSFARIVRAAVMGVMGNEYIEAARAGGAGTVHTIFKYVLPNAAGPIIVQATMSIANVIKSIAGLSFMGLGIIPPAPEWGAMLSESREFMRYYPYLVVFPGIAIVLTSLSLNLLGDGLRDALDPRMKD